MAGLTVLVVGGGGRESALYWAIGNSPLVAEVHCAPGNGGIPPEFRHSVKDTNISGIVDLAETLAADLVVIGPEAPLCEDLVNWLEAEGIKAFGPSKAAAVLEGSKAWMKRFCTRHNIPTAPYTVADSLSEAEEAIRKHGWLIVKADGLCGGKGVTVGNTPEEAIMAAAHLMVERVHGDAGKLVVIEQKLVGRECSVMVICDGEGGIMLPPSRDHKRAFDRDTGPNTGGMGAYAPLPDVDGALLADIKRRFVEPILAGMKDENRPFRGIMYLGLMLTDDGPMLLEVNVRFGDPETQVVLPLLESDIVPYLLAAAEHGGLSGLGPLEISSGAAVSTVVVADGYPSNYEKGFVVRDIEAAERLAVIFHANTAKPEGGETLSDGGRLLNCVGRGDTILEARVASLEAAMVIVKANHGKVRCRSDIAADVGD